MRLIIQSLASLMVVGSLELTGTTAALAQDERSQWDGVFSEAQAERGFLLFEEYCIVCHGGGMAPDLIGEGFNNTWDGASLGELFEFTQLTMPQNAPGSLTAQEYADIISHVLDGGQFPAGDAELHPDVDALNRFRFVAVRPAAAPHNSDSQHSTDVPSLTDDEFQRLFARMLGTWEHKPDKSAGARNTPPPRRWSVVYADGGDRKVNYTNTQVDAAGDESVSYGEHVLDGNDYNRPSGDRSIAKLPLDENTITGTLKDAGTVTSRNTQFFSNDGQRMTVVMRSVDDQGRERITAINIYDKVE